jgi:hypothetical protein
MILTGAWLTTQPYRIVAAGVALSPYISSEIPRSQLFQPVSLPHASPIR